MLPPRRKSLTVNFRALALVRRDVGICDCGINMLRSGTTKYSYDVLVVLLTTLILGVCY